mmetsp:Transcript_23839/g.36773  ORF Transcript_23839/g.36773 Transcript_23839/m.36773 type:complete len:259 (+) Transcript_23839:90-866(+)|eukprot:CAMPEP_0196813866 /NCGR_PEP_ID=MMETSP1362-20130617/39795_1 /TAXON_ID=163516 /ORGANISM="Leptocylindrus danicus, Strain CCMP1856" /LENGTH=258 /DNA_ID=CAMNT_0042190275 /DNA_START=1 /DNA_END=777 /DNA_ORIENTATION=+
MQGKMLNALLTLLVYTGNGVISHVHGFSSTVVSKHHHHCQQQKNSWKKDTALFLGDSLPLTRSKSSDVVTKARRSALFSSGGADMGETGSSTSTTEQGKMGQVLEALTKFSNFASMLCVIDCTVLPAVTVLLPLIGLAASPAQSAWLHELGHKVAMYFVLPVGSLASSLGYLSHRKLSYLMSAVIGLALIYASNGHGGPILSLIPHELGHSMHAGVLHRPSNIMGCCFLLGSNYLSRKLSHGDCCDHDHGHSHHDHSH